MTTKQIFLILLLLLSLLFISGCISFPGQKSWDKPQQSQPQPQNPTVKEPPKPPQIIITPSPSKISVIPVITPQLLPKKYNVSFSAYDNNLIVEIPSQQIQSNLTFECKSFTKNVSFSFDTKKVKVFEFQNITCKNRDGIVKYNNNKINFIIPRDNFTKTMVIEE